jgi:polysaccharide export outer membrane protein
MQIVRSSLLAGLGRDPSAWRRGSGRVAALLVLAVAAGCGTPSEPIPPDFPKPAPPRPFSAGEYLRQFDAVTPEPYRLGEGDLVTIQVWDKPDLSGPHTVGPDGVVTIPFAGAMHIAGMTRDEAAKAIQEALLRLYTGVTVTLRVDQYVSNRITVVGRVHTPGVLRFENNPTVLEVLARAGGLLDSPVTLAGVNGPFNLTHCAVIRGRDRVAWIDLNSLWDGRNLALNLRLRPDDIVLVPEDSDLPIYVLGQVLRPGPFRYTRGMTFMDALALAGGATRDAQPSQMILVRPSQNLRMVLTQADLLAPVEGANVGLQRGDILYVPTSVLADVGYILEKLNALSWVFVAQTVKH